MKKIFIIGSGNFGTALAKILSKNNLIHIYSKDFDTINNINKKKENIKYLKNIKLNRNITASTDISNVKNYDIIIFAVPSSQFKYVSKELKNFYTNQIIVSASKGIGQKGEILTDIIIKELKCNPKKVTAISGPSIGIELAKEYPTYLIIGGNRIYTQIVKRVFQTNTLILRCTRDIKGIQLLGVYKNILAILVGLCDGLNLGNNFKSALITKAYSEFYYLNENKNIRRHSFIDFAGLGDLYVTSTCPDSRNRTFGKLLANSNSIKTIKEEIGQVIEGYDNLLRLNKINKQFYDVNLIKTLLKVTTLKTKVKKRDCLLRYLHSAEIKALVFAWGNVITKDYYSLHVAKILANKYNLDSNEVLNNLEANEEDILLGKESLKSFFQKIQNIYPVINYSFFKQSYINSITWNSDLLEFIKTINKKYDLYILSNNYDLITPLLRKKLSNIFKGMVFSNEVGMIKPNNNIYTYLLKKYNLRAENCIYIDDS